MITDETCIRLRENSENTYRRMGSKPISPGKDPSNFSGRTKNGIDLDIASAFKETVPARADYNNTKDMDQN